MANRGEIAVRVMRTLRRLGIASVAVFHAEDAGGLAVREADESVELFGASPVAAYLDIDAIVAACARTGAQAVHPGFGFLAENAAFAEALAAAGITFVGPRPEAIRAMGDKLESKRLARRGGRADGARLRRRRRARWRTRSRRPTASATRSCSRPAPAAAARACGSPATPGECREAFERASGEALASFGDGRVFVERFIERPRHIEIQVTGRRARHRGASRRARVLDPAALPEGDRGGPSPFVDEDDARGDGRPGRRTGARRRLRLRGHGRDDRRRASATSTSSR